MEYNKEKATMAKKDAESKIEENDFIGAKKSVLEAQSLYPGLDGIPQLMEILDVLIAGEERINGKEHWYHVLGVSPTADDGELKKQYRKWALKLHPDKNGSVGAEGAFKLISAAYKFLIDKQAREEYNQETVYSSGPAPWWAKQAPAHAGGPSAPPQPSSHTTPAPAPAQNVPPAHPRQTGESSMPAHPGGSSAPWWAKQAPAHAGGPSAPPQPSSHTTPAPAPAQNVPPAHPRQTGESSMPAHPGGSSAPTSPTQAQNVPPAPPRQTGESSMPSHPGGSSTASEFSSTKSRKRKAKVPATPNPPTTFFTICYGCRYRWEYPRKYLGCSLRCIRCSNVFLAVEMTSSKARPAPRQRKT